MRSTPIAAIVVTHLLLTCAPAHAQLSEAARLGTIYETILHARFDRAAQEIARACPPAPIEACQSLTAVSLWWQILVDPESRERDQAFQQAAETAVAAAERWTKREPRRAEAWFYLAGAHGPLTQWRVLRGERLAAARSGKRIKDALERALALDPALTDAYFGIGLYHYYADVAPAALKVLRFLLLLPGGDRELGLKEMLQARERGQLLRDEADFQMHYLYLWYERQPQRALELLQGLDTRYPDNPVFLQRIAEVHDEYRRDPAASAAAWDTLLTRARADRVYAPRLVETRARLGLAAQEIALARPERAIAVLDAVLAQPPTEPHGAHALAFLLMGTARERSGRRDLAAAAYERASALAPANDPSRIRARARAALDRVRGAK